MALTAKQIKTVEEQRIPIWTRNTGRLALISPVEYEDEHDSADVTWIRVVGTIAEWDRTRQIVDDLLRRYANDCPADLVPVSLEYYGTCLHVDPVWTSLDEVKSVWNLDEEKDLPFRTDGVYLHLSLWDLHLNRFRSPEDRAPHDRLPVQISWRINEKHCATTIHTTEIEAVDLLRQMKGLR